MSEPMDLNEACAMTDQFGRFLKGLARLQDAAAALRNADQVIAERRTHADALLSDITTTTTRLEALRAACTEAETKAKTTATSAKSAADALIAEAQAKAGDILATAQDRAKKLADSEAQMIARAAAEEGRLIELQKAVKDAEARLEQAKEAARRAFGG